MKAERRHELQENELAKVIKNAPGFWQESGAKYLLVAVALLLIVLLVRYYRSSQRESAAMATQGLATARTLIEELQTMAGAGSFMPPTDQATRRRQAFNDANSALAEAISLTDDRKVQAEALVAKGDLSWTLASLPPIPEAATQPALLVRDPKDLLNTATEAYQTVVSNFADQTYAAIAARFGLAAIAENRGEWDLAKSQYEKLAADTKDWPAYQQLASARLRALDLVRNPVILGAPSTMPALSDLPELPSTNPTTAALSPFVAAPSTTQATTHSAVLQATATVPAAATQGAPAATTTPTTPPADAGAAATTAPTTQP